MTVRAATPALQRRTIVLAAALAILAFLSILTVALVRGRPTEDRSVAATGEAPGFALPAFQGGTFTLADHASGPVFVYFWASWCTPCTEEAPLIQKLYPEYQAKGYTFVGVNIWDAEPDARAFVQQQQLTFPAVTDPGGKTYLSFGVQQLPTAFFLKKGLESDRKFIGQLTESQLRELLDHAGSGS